jgi:hypothetical protein
MSSRLTEPSLSRYYFNVVAGSETIVDFEGTELGDLRAAKLDAISDARWLMSQAVLKGHDISDNRIEISDTDGNVLAVIAFRDTITRFE